MNRSITMAIAAGFAAAAAASIAAVGAHGAQPSHNGRIAFQIGGQEGEYSDIALMNADGTGIVRVTQDYSYDAQPAFSPDGKLIAFESFRNAQQRGDSDVYTSWPDGSHRTQLTFHAGTDADPAWSGDGSKIAFESTRAGGQPEI